MLYDNNNYESPKYDLQGDLFSKIRLEGPLLVLGSSGTSGQVLTSQGGNPPKWTTVSGGGSDLPTLGTAGQMLRVNSGASSLEYFTPVLGNGIYGGSGDVDSADVTISSNLTFGIGVSKNNLDIVNNSTYIAAAFSSRNSDFHVTSDMDAAQGISLRSVERNAGTETLLYIPNGGSYIQLKADIDGTGTDFFEFNLSADGTVIYDETSNQFGIQYAADYSASIIPNDRSIPDVGTVKQIARPYKVYTALLSQTGTSAPTATVLENTLGATVTWSRNNIGQYQATSSSPIFLGTVTGFGNIIPAGDAIYFTIQENTDSSCIIISRDLSGAEDEMQTDLPSFIEIRVYP